MSQSDNLEIIFSKIRHSPNTIMRKLQRIPSFQARQEQIFQTRLKNHAPFLPKLDREDTKIVESLQQNGFYITSIDKLGLPFSNLMINSAMGLAERLKQVYASKDDRISYKSHGVSLTKSYLVEFPEIFLWALETRLLDIVENYIGLPVIYQGLAIRRDFTDGQKIDVRRWHLDWEDRHTIKLIVYLNDVDIDGGPFEYIDKATSNRAIEALNYYNLGYVSDEVMSTAVPQSQWQSCIGNLGTVIIADTSYVFHRARPPVKHERFSLSFCFTSNRPKVMWTCSNVSQEQWQALERQLNRRQRACLSHK